MGQLPLCAICIAYKDTGITNLQVYACEDEFIFEENCDIVPDSIIVDVFNDNIAPIEQLTCELYKI